MSQQNLIANLASWFHEVKRPLPWRQSPAPYAVWVSEVMLQQTQVSVVIPYFYRWMSRFPTIHSLAIASTDEVIKVWEGLGYYSRARNLHQAAQFLVEHHNGELPSSYEELLKIKGLGPYTAGAILNFAFHKKCAAVDGNVIRVITRLCNIDQDIAKSSTIKKIQAETERLLPDHEPWIISEALIELGATLCKRSPACRECPIQSYCQASALNKVSEIPYNSKKMRYETLSRLVAVIDYGQKILLRKGEARKIMADLYEFPYFECEMEIRSKLTIQRRVKKEWGFQVRIHQPLDSVSHSFTRFKAKLFPWLMSVQEELTLPGYHWVDRKKLSSLAFSSGHRQILEQLNAN